VLTGGQHRIELTILIMLTTQKTARSVILVVAVTTPPRSTPRSLCCRLNREGGWMLSRVMRVH